MKAKEKILEVDKTQNIIIVVIAVLGIICLYLYFPYFEDKDVPTYKNIRLENFSNCSGMDLEDTAFCLVEYVGGFYNYTVKNDTFNISLEEIKKTGGDCHDYALLYEEMGNQLGYWSSTHYIQTNITAHRFAIINDETGYCKLDMLSKPDCIIYIA